MTSLVSLILDWMIILCSFSSWLSIAVFCLTYTTPLRIFKLRALKILQWSIIRCIKFQIVEPKLSSEYWTTSRESRNWAKFEVNKSKSPMGRNEKGWSKPRIWYYPHVARYCRLLWIFHHNLKVSTWKVMDVLLLTACKSKRCGKEDRKTDVIEAKLWEGGLLVSQWYSLCIPWLWLRQMQIWGQKHKHKCLPHPLDAHTQAGVWPEV